MLLQHGIAALPDPDEAEEHADDSNDDDEEELDDAQGVEPPQWRNMGPLDDSDLKSVMSRTSRYVDAMCTSLCNCS